MGTAWLPARIKRWLARPKPSAAPKVKLPWWGQLLHTQDKATLAALLESGLRLKATLATPGWADVEAVFQDWQVRYTEQAQRLGQRMEEQHGQLVLTEDDTTADDRRRLIAAAQAAALKGALAEVRQRAQADVLLTRRNAQTVAHDPEDEQSLV